MALRTGQIAVTTTATELRPSGAPTSPALGDRATIIVTAGASQDLFVGASGVTTSTGFKVPKNASLTLTLHPGERIYGIAAGSDTVYVARQD